MAAPTRSVAAFDLDGTLTRRDTLLPFLRRTCGRARTSYALLGQSLLIVRALLGEGLRQNAKEALLAGLLRGRPVADLELAAEAYADFVVAHRLRRRIVERVEWHRRNEHALVIVSASPELYIEPIARRLGFHAALGSRLQVTSEGRLTGRIEGLNCRGAEKVARLRSWIGGSSAFLYAYGDSAGDRELLSVADVAVRVGRRGVPPAPELPVPS